MELDNLKIGDIVMAKFEWRKEGRSSVSIFHTIQRGSIRELGEHYAVLEVCNPDNYIWRKKTVSKDDILEKVKHGRYADCCLTCAIGFDPNCGSYNEKIRAEARFVIEKEDNFNDK